MIRKFLLSLMIICLIGLPIRAQQKLQQKYQHWYTYFGNFKLSDRWSIPFDVQVRIRDGFTDKGQILTRGGLQYAANKRNSFLLGYAYVTTYADVPDVYLPEHRIFQQYIYQHPAGKASMSHRFRLEQRWVAQQTSRPGAPTERDWQYGNRVRYFHRTIIPVQKHTQSTKFYVALQNEIFLNLWNNQINDKFIDQNRLLLTPGYLLNAALKLEIGYMNQFLQTAAGSQTMNHILHFAVFHNF
ncbi:DUF2490 domain-containing protein [Chitinophaga pendula]|uniref:DUF2490 domain-containing protein n=1 Tax=Chitinophaga TaxID=79328 RepID=UPI000BAF2CDF|nr:MULTISPECIES: DUF2490 domain-containing protein [Chitinophaga]ASZ09971.1 hypothetical protein CK934_02740 [Chitinophaga sp. MD30]UCJ07087.1 DUF2490 domain-containing protein [Chitinophaga pendula]